MCSGMYPMLFYTEQGVAHTLINSSHLRLHVRILRRYRVIWQLLQSGR